MYAIYDGEQFLCISTDSERLISLLPDYKNPYYEVYVVDVGDFLDLQDGYMDFNIYHGEYNAYDGTGNVEIYERGKLIDVIEE